MEMVKDVSTNLSHSFSVSERKNIIISGVVKIKGRIDAIGYIDENAKKESSVFTKLFK